MNTALTTTTLYSYRAIGMSLETAIAAVSSYLPTAIALLYSPQQCRLARLSENGKLYDAYNRDESVKLKYSSLDIFEARLFNPDGELRWLNREDGLGDTAFITEKTVSLEGFESLEPQAGASLEQQYLIWGEKANGRPNADNWQRLAEARIGKLDVPLTQPLQKNQRVYLITKEYIAPVDQYENCAVIEERLIKLEAK